MSKSNTKELVVEIKSIHVRHAFTKTLILHNSQTKITTLKHAT